MSEDSSVFREDPPNLFPLPTEEWRFEPRISFTLMKDKASATSKAARLVFCVPAINDGSSGTSESEEEEFEVRVDMCFTHASLSWISYKKGKFR
mmetsp:Transcript_11616/g.15316  ORF Transcript_11616/g.15316 Transcript_11616/m.15316 type:complete len:94 (-) Transcript_11616:168-449(-)|eukprot:CAMPEP_0198142464 /NCGR_PEP_ID=MMETSP1443-20131203/5244_1 /TAXON_ID=186043 /ORGANISM="Entomoneis sp., Strain CCMP2396" /LENGTH=93 /DNA_ID=CAMNT_0043805475 /DNA_START=564 /DNA_END=845 /DNA_ORIENTATION=+